MFLRKSLCMCMKIGVILTWIVRLLTVYISDQNVFSVSNYAGVFPFRINDEIKSNLRG